MSIESRRAVRNLFACLAPPSHDVAVDLVRNLRCLDPSSQVLLYEGSGERIDEATRAALRALRVVFHPAPQRIRERQGHRFALACLRFALDHLGFDTVTFVDARQLAVRPGWSEQVSALVRGDRVGLVGAPVEVQPVTTRIATAIAAWQELPLWRPLLDRFYGGRGQFVRWTRWQSMVVTRGAAEELMKLVASDRVLGEILAQSRLWSLGEVLFPTLVGLLGFELVSSAEAGEHIVAGDSGEPPTVAAALASRGAQWLYPVPARYGDPERSALRRHYSNYRRVGAAEPLPAEPEELIYPGDEIFGSLWETTSQVEGWLTRSEARLLACATQTALHECPSSEAIVEIGSYRGRGTSVLGRMVKEIRPAARVWSIDPHDGFLGALDHGLELFDPSLPALLETLQAAGLDGHVEVVKAHSREVHWTKPIALLWIDGLHDYPNVARDFLQFEPWLVEGALIAFHDYSSYFSGVMAFVDELPPAEYQPVARAKDLIVVRKLTASARRGGSAASEHPVSGVVSALDVAAARRPGHERAGAR